MIVAQEFKGPAIAPMTAARKDPDAVVDYRPDIDGLRGVAVLAVLWFHIYPGTLAGGYVGVDVFFVISGFLITKILLRDIAQGKFSVANFYRRRIRRIFPALSVFLFATLALAWYAALPAEMVRISHEVAAGAFFVANLYFARNIGYFSGSVIIKPLIHLWSLGIEEQFYLLFPLGLWLVRKFRRGPELFICAGLAISLYLNVKGVQVDRSDAFYFPHTRLWELLIGALTACFFGRRNEASAAGRSPVAATAAAVAGAGAVYLWYNANRIRFVGSPSWHPLVICAALLIGWELLVVRGVSRWAGETRPKAVRRNFLLEFAAWLAGNAAAAAGLALIYRAATTYDSTHTLFPGWAAVVPCAGAALIIAAGRRSWINRGVLSNPVLVGIGLISYPLYLWHWTLYSYAYILNDGFHEDVKPGLIVAAFALSILTYFFVERPLRRSKSTWVVPSLAGAVALVGIAGFGFSRAHGFFLRPHIQRYARQSLAFEWNTLAGPASMPGCEAKFKIKNGGYCLISDIGKPPTVAFIGDSHAHHFYPGLSKYFQGKGENVLLLGGSGCVPFYNVASHMKIDPDKCMPVINQIYELIEKTPSIKQVVFASRGSGYVLGTKSSEMDSWDRAISLAGRPGLPYPEVFRRGFRNSILRLRARGKSVGFIYDVPEICLDPRGCVHMRPVEFYNKRLTSPCAISIEKYRARNQVYYSVVDSVLKEFAQVKVFNPADYLCDRQYCYGLLGANLMYRDDNHLSVSGSLFFADKFKF